MFGSFFTSEKGRTLTSRTEHIEVCGFSKKKKPNGFECSHLLLSMMKTVLFLCSKDDKQGNVIFLMNFYTNTISVCVFQKSTEPNIKERYLVFIFEHSLDLFIR